MEEWAKHFINWITTAGLLASIGFIARLSYRITNLEKDVCWLKSENNESRDLQQMNNNLLMEIRERLIKLETKIEDKK